MKYKYFNKKFIMTTFKPKKGETIVIHVDADKFCPEEMEHMVKLVSRMFPDNNVMITLVGMDLSTK